MYKLLSIAGKDYKLEYTIEASLYDECIEKMIDFSGKLFGSGEIAKTLKDIPDEYKEKVTKEVYKNILSGFGNMPSTTLSVFHAGLLEHHGTGRNGDGTIKTKEDTKNVIRDYFLDHKEDGTGNFYDLFQICMEQMGEDNFFDLTGIPKILTPTETDIVKMPNRAQRRASKKTSEK